MADEEFTCAQCGIVYEKGRPDSESLAESRAIFGPVPESELAIVCDDCFNAMGLNGTGLLVDVTSNDPADQALADALAKFLDYKMRAILRGVDNANNGVEPRDRRVRTRLRGKAMSKWVSVMDRLPENGDPVLVVNAHNRWSICVGLRSKAEGMRYRHGSGHPTDLDPITHWMPLPEPPADEDGE